MRIIGTAPRAFFTNTILASKDTLRCAAHDEPLTFDWCEANCPKYHTCDTIAWANDESMLLDSEAWECASCREIVNGSDDVCWKCGLTAASEYRMEISLERTNHEGDTPVEIIVIGTDIESLKNDLNWIILEAVELRHKESGSYAIHVTYTKQGEYVDCDEFACFCNIQERIILY